MNAAIARFVKVNIMNSWDKNKYYIFTINSTFLSFRIPIPYQTICHLEPPSLTEQFVISNPLLSQGVRNLFVGRFKERFLGR
jgi:hypothetical protein